MKFRSVVPAFVAVWLALFATLTTAAPVGVPEPLPQIDGRQMTRSDLLEERQKWRASFYADDNGVIDPARMQAAREAAQRIPLNPRVLPAAVKDANGNSTPMNYVDPVTNALVTPAGWTWRGPGNVGGRTRSLVIHPTQTNRLWLGSVVGGLWYSSNSGTSWAPVDDFMANLAISTVIMDPTNSNIMYVGTGEGFFNADSVRGAGVFKSTDGGVTWSQLAATNTPNFYYVNRLAISPNGATLLAATSTGIFRSNDGGTSWSQVQVTLSRMTQVAFDPNNSLNAIATGYSSLAFYSNNGGLTWTAATGLPAPGTGSLPGRTEFAYANSAAGTVFAGFWNNGTSSLYKSVDGGQTYAQVTVAGSTNWMSSQGWYSNAIWVDPTNANTLIVGGLDLYRSTNGGANLTKISTWQSAPASAHADHHGIVSDPGYNGTTNTRVYFANDGGLYKAENALTAAGTTGWTELNNTLGITEFYGAAGNPTSLTIVAGAQDNGTLRGPSGNTEGWTVMNGGDGGFCAADQTDPNYFYGEYVYATVARSNNAGLSSSNIYSGITDANSSTGAEFIAPFILDPNNQSRMLVGGKSLWRSNDVKAPSPAWTAIKSATGATSADNITAIAVAPGNADLIYVGHRNGNVYKTTNGTAVAPTWTQVDTNGVGLPNRRVGRIVFDPNNNNRVYVAFGGYSDAANFGATNLWRSNDGAATWASVTSNLPLAPIYGLAIRPDNSNVIYAATDLGVFGSEDAGATWSATNVGPSNVSTAEIFFVERYLVVATHGRGVFQVPVLPPPPDVTPPTLSITPATTVTNVSPIAFRFEFSEAVTGFTAASVTVTGGTAGALTGTGPIYFLPITPTLANTPVTVAVAPGAVVDNSNNALAVGATATVTWDPTSPYLYSTGFDGASAPPAWRSTGGVWARGVPAKGPLSDHTGGGGSLFATGLTAANYPDGAYAILTAQPVTIPASPARSYKLRFWMWLSTETNFDGGNLEASIDGGPFAVVPGTSLSSPYNSPGGLDGLLGQPGWTGDTTGFNAWRRIRMDLSAYAGKTVQFRFVFGSDGGVNSSGWFIDDFAVEQDTLTTNAGSTPQSATINTAFAAPLTVTVKDGANTAVPGVSVTFTAPSSGASGTFSNNGTAITVPTDGFGVASAPFTANSIAGGSYNVTAAATGLIPVNFSLSNVAGPPSQVVANAGTTPQQTDVNTAFPNALAVTVTDAANNPVSGVIVAFTAPASGASGTFSNNTATISLATNALGVASAPFTANATSGGAYMVTASAASLPAANFLLTNRSIPSITLNPANTSVSVGATASFTAGASGIPAPTVQWFVSADGGVSFSLVVGATSTTLSFTAQALDTNKLYRATFTNGAGSATTTSAKLTASYGPILNIDNSDTTTTYDAATDGVLLLRYLLGYRGSALVANALGNGASVRDAAQIATHIATNLGLFDVDGDGQTLAMTDGLMILRRLLNPAANANDPVVAATITANAKNSGRSNDNVLRAIDALKP